MNKSWTRLFFILFVMLTQTVGAEPVQRVWNRYELLQLLAGATISEQIERLSKWSKTRLQTDLQCDKNPFFGIGDTECLLGMRNYALSFFSDPESRPPENISVKISSANDWAPMDTNAIKPQIRIPYSATPVAMARFLKNELSKPSYAQRLRFLNEIADLSSEIEQLTGLAIEISPEVGNLEALASLYRLSLLAKENPHFLEKKPDVLKLTDSFQYIYEENLKLKTGIDVRADIARLRRFLYEPEQVYFEEPNWYKIFYLVRDQINETRQQMINELHIDTVECSPIGHLRQKDCLQGLQRGLVALKNPAIHAPPIDVLIITDSSEMSSKADFYYDNDAKKSVLLLRADTSPSALASFFSRRGWADKILAGGEP